MMVTNHCRKFMARLIGAECVYIGALAALVFALMNCSITHEILVSIKMPILEPLCILNGILSSMRVASRLQDFKRLHCTLDALVRVHHYLAPEVFRDIVYEMFKTRMRRHAYEAAISTVRHGRASVIAWTELVLQDGTNFDEHCLTRTSLWHRVCAAHAPARWDH